MHLLSQHLVFSQLSCKLFDGFNSNCKIQFHSILKSVIVSLPLRQQYDILRHGVHDFIRYCALSGICFQRKN